jgi:hypothetical protein
MKNKTITCDGVEYEIKAVEDENGWRAAVFHSGKRLCADAIFSRDVVHDYSACGGEVDDILLGVLENEVKNGKIRAK